MLKITWKRLAMVTGAAAMAAALGARSTEKPSVQSGAAPTSRPLEKPEVKVYVESEAVFHAPCCIVQRSAEEEAYRPGPLPDTRYDSGALIAQIRSRADRFNSLQMIATVETRLIWLGAADAPFEAVVEFIRDEGAQTIEHDLVFRLRNGRWQLESYEQTPIGSQSESISRGDLRWQTMENIFSS